ncbi:MAG TPA: Holliday junction branch migration protein RuvA [candidate division Zixibacteria bacterium]|nr:Holliday junction branch migration protein RuvA [candidate division Zixibacteria bacterium]
MIDFIRGYIAKIGENFVVIDVAGVGYYIAISSNTAQEIGQAGEEAMILTRLLHREDSMELFGFATEPERQLYDALISVSGIGPKMAMSILSGIGAEEFVCAVANRDFKMLATIKGLGKKRAEKLCFELEGALDGIQVATSPRGGASVDAIDALVALGYSRAEAGQAVRDAAQIVGDSNADALIKTALSIIRK